MPARSDPIADAELEALFAGLAGLARFGVALSGGPDSTALLLLADRWARRRAAAPEIVALTVDHGLRDGSRAEAEAAARFAGTLGRPGRVLAWEHDGPPPASDVQAAARAARYDLLAAAAADLGLEAVLLAHTLDDKAETFMIRLARGSGLSGLAAMPAERIHGGVRFLRPLAGVGKARLLATLEAAGVAYAEDPSNADTDRFLRARVRALLPALASIGLDAPRLAATADRLARAAAVVDGQVREAVAGALDDRGGVVRIDMAGLLAAPDEVALRLLAIAHGRVRPSEHPPRAAGLEAFLAEARAAPPPRRRTTGGVVLDPRRDGLWLYAEAGRRGFPRLVLTGPGTHVWDGRFTVSVERPLPAPVTVAAAAGPSRRSDMPSRAAASLPALLVGDDAGGGTDAPDGVVIRRITEVFTQTRQPRPKVPEP